MGEDAGAVPALVKAVESARLLVEGQPCGDLAAAAGLGADLERGAAGVEVERVERAGKVRGKQLGAEDVREQAQTHEGGCLKQGDHG